MTTTLSNLAEDTSADVGEDSNIVLPDALLLAAGGARRFGSPKLLADLHGAPLLWYALDALRDTDVAKRTLVLGANADAVHRCYLDWCHARGLLSNLFTTVVNAGWERGLSESLRVGLSHRTPGVPLLVALADQPCVTSAHLHALVRAYGEPSSNPEGNAVAESGCDAVASDYDGVAGVPALFSPEAQELLLALKGDAGARRLLNEEPALRVRRVPFPSPERVDVDVPEDLARAEESFTARSSLRISP